MGPDPLVYEINTRCWLRDLASQAGSPLTLAAVPETEIASWRKLGFTHVWLMGVWAVGPRSRAHSVKSYPPFSPATPACPQDVLGSPYALEDYQVSPNLGGTKALQAFRARLAAAGLKLLLDFVPNHTGLDHRWLTQYPELFVQTRPRAPGSFRQQTRWGPRWLAHGRDPNFEPWLDTAQLDYRNPDTHAAMLAQLQAIARLCDGARCDMAMLVLNEVFQKTWRADGRAGCPQPAELAGSREIVPRAEDSPPCPAPVPEFWAEAIPAVKKLHPEFLFLAEVYWGLEARLQGLGFDYTYDKTLYDHLVARRAADAHKHLLQASPAYLQASAHFLENHDEARIASVLSPEEHRAAALFLLSLPGLRLLHEGQLTGARQKASLHLSRRPAENPNPEISALYENLLSAIQKTSLGRGQAKVLETTPAWPGNPTAKNIVLVQWPGRAGSLPLPIRWGEGRGEGTTLNTQHSTLDNSQPAAAYLVIVNLAPHPSQCYARLQIPELGAHRWKMQNLLGPELFERNGPELQERGLYLDVPAHAAQLFQFTTL